MSRWVRALAQSGRRGLRKARHVGRRPRLSAAQLRGLERALKHRPAQYGFAAGRWTAAKVRDLIERRTGARYHPAHVSRIVRELKERQHRTRYRDSYSELRDSYRELKAMMAAARLARHVRRSQPPSGGV